MAKQFMNDSAEISHNVRRLLEQLELGRFNPVAGKVRVIVDAKTIREDNILKAMGLSDVIVLSRLVYYRLTRSKKIKTYIRKIGGFEDDAATHSQR